MRSDGVHVIGKSPLDKEQEEEMYIHNFQGITKPSDNRISKVKMSDGSLGISVMGIYYHLWKLKSIHSAVMV